MNFNNITDISTVIFVLGAFAFLLSIMTEVLKRLPGIKRMPTELLVFILSMVLCPLSLAAYCSVQQIRITWYLIFATLIIAFIVALIAMDGWERVTELAKRFMKGGEDKWR